MSNSRIPLQSFYLYNNGWSKDVDQFFVSMLVFYKGDTKWRGTQIPNSVLQKVMGDMSKYFGINLQWEEACYRRDMLYRRYQTFKVVLDFPGTFWHRKLNVVKATKAMWKGIFEVDEFAKAYYYVGECEWNRLDMLFFVPNTVEQFNPDDDEVTSPQQPTARRRLFQEDDLASDQLSTTNKAIPTLVASNGGVRISEMRAEGREPGYSRALEQTFSSSCASSSPWLKK